MSKYYCLIAGLPNINPDDTKLTYTVSEFKAELEPILTQPDKQVMFWFYLKYDNRNILTFLRDKVADVKFDARGNFSKEEVTELFDGMKKKEKMPKNNPFPAYIIRFFQSYLSRLENEESMEIHLLEDQLSSLYYAEAIKCGNEFLSSWFELNLNIGNVLAVNNCRKYGLNKDHYIVGDNEVAEQLRQSRAREFHFGDAIEYMRELTQIVEEKEPVFREKRLDTLRWKWLDEHTFFTTFDIENVLSYLLRLEMIERWVALDKVRGGITFRQLVSDMKQESAKTLEEFKENNK